MGIGDRVFYLRNEGLGRKISRSEFAEPLCVSPGVIQNIEEVRYKDGESGIPRNVLMAISSHYRVNMAWLENGIGEMLMPENEEEKVERLIAEHMPDEKAITKAVVRAFASLPDSEWVKLKEIIDKIKEG